MLCEKEKCTGCMACVNICPTIAIDVFNDDEGFLRPQINDTLCIKCYKCSKACPVITPVSKKIDQQTVYAGWTKDKKIRKESTSGGIFTEMSKIILSNDGVVFGAALDENLIVKHISIENIKEMNKLRGSKYVQSDIGKSYVQAKEYLEKQVPVLFSGTPCQIAGLYGYLKKEYDNLYTCDLVCHGVPSPKVYNSYLDYIKKRHGSDIIDVRFRDKKVSWSYFNMKILFKSGKVYSNGYFKDPYIIGFLRDNFLRPSCHNCLYTNTSRMGDITIADFWGYRSTGKEDKNNDKGISLAILNTKNGELLFNECKNNMIYYERTLQEAVNGNRCLSSSFPQPESREQFWKDYNSMDFEDIVVKYMYPSKITFVEKIRSTFKYEVARWILAPLAVKNRLKRLAK